jgi:malate dehydrogenase (quinone)
MGNSCSVSKPDVILVGSGIMSATLGVFLKELSPELQIEMYEVLEGSGLESSNAWNNAGTGHAANCELNYTPERENGTVDISKALEVNVEFDLSRQLWSYLVKKQKLPDPKTFIHSVPHMSFVTGDKNVAFLKKRYEALKNHHCYQGMEYTEDLEQLRKWVPLVVEGRDPKEKVAATRMITGTDVDYGSLTRSLVQHLSSLESFSVQYSSQAINIQRELDGYWRVDFKNTKSGDILSRKARFVFLGAGGGTLPLLQKSQIPEIRGYAGFPVSGIWLRCDRPEISARHEAKVYGKASVGSPPMSVPHLDTRVVEGKRSILFGPYAGFSTKFLKHGSLLDFFKSIRAGNIKSLLAVARDNMALTEYLIGQIFQSSHHRFSALQEYYPEAKQEDWRLEVAGQRVQIIKPDPKRGAILEFGTELVSSSDQSLVGLLGASPGASTAAFIALHLLEKCFAKKLPTWLPKLKEIIPSYRQSIADDEDLCKKIRAETAAVLKLQNISESKS